MNENGNRPESPAIELRCCSFSPEVNSRPPLRALCLLVRHSLGDGGCGKSTKRKKSHPRAAVRTYAHPKKAFFCSLTTKALAKISLPGALTEKM
jgi:hypothetical protein